MPGYDSVIKNQKPIAIPTLHQCITIMSYYEHKSLEDLRFEDYQAKRKFPQQQQQQSGFGSTLFGSTSTTPATGTGSIFGSNGMTQSTLSSSGFGLESGATGTV
jgi:nuclear pore complex protein Nup98-Nup96